MYQETKLANGFLVASETMPEAETVSVGIFTQRGSRHETPLNNGVAHFLEHMIFKGTPTRTALDIALEVENIGGHMNAYTGYETTAYHLKLLPEHLGTGVTLLGDILQNSLFDSGEMERERGVILQEIGESMDDPQDVVFQTAQQLLYPNNSLGRPILGTPDTIAPMQADDLRAFISQNYGSNTMMLAAAGKVTYAELVNLAEAVFGTLQPVAETTPVQPAPKPEDKHIERDMAQVQLVLSYSAVSHQDALYYPLRLWSALLGDGMSSPLFQEIREKRGLAYSIFSFTSSYADCGDFGIYAGTSPKQVTELLDVIHNEINKLCLHIEPTALERVKTQYKARLVMMRESTDNRMEWIARSHATYGSYKTPQELLDKVQAVTIESCLHAGQFLRSQAASMASIGKKPA